MTENERIVSDIINKQFYSRIHIDCTKYADEIAKQIVESLSLPSVIGSCCQEYIPDIKDGVNFCPHCGFKINDN